MTALSDVLKGLAMFILMCLLGYAIFFYSERTK